MRKVEAAERTWNEVCRRPPAPKASPQPMMVSRMACRHLSASCQHGARVNAPLGISADSSKRSIRGSRTALSNGLCRWQLSSFCQSVVLRVELSMSGSASAGAERAASGSANAQAARLPQRARGAREAHLQIGRQAGVRIRAPVDVRAERAVGRRHHAAARHHRRHGRHVLGAAARAPDLARHGVRRPRAS